MLIKFSAIPGTTCPNIPNTYTQCGSKYCIESCPHKGDIFIQEGKPYVLLCNYDEIRLTEGL